MSGYRMPRGGGWIEAGSGFVHNAAKYRNGKCVCDICKKDNTEDVYKRRYQKRDKLMILGLLRKDASGRRICTDPACKHGTNSGYNYFWCQCEVCTKAHSKLCNDRRRVREGK